MKKAIIMLAVLATPQMIINAYQTRGYYAVGGEWFIIPFVLLLVYAMPPTLITFTKEGNKSAREPASKEYSNEAEL